MTFRLTRRAHRDAERLAAWWRSQRPESRELFTRELIAALEQAVSAPQSGKRYETARAQTFGTS